MVGDMVKERAGRDAGEEGEGVAQLLDPGQFDIDEDEVAHAQLHGADAVLVGRSCRPHVFEATQLRRAGVRSCEWGNGGVIIGSYGTHEVEGDTPW